MLKIILDLREEVYGLLRIREFAYLAVTTAFPKQPL